MNTSLSCLDSILQVIRTKILNSYKISNNQIANERRILARVICFFLDCFFLPDQHQWYQPLLDLESIFFPPHFKSCLLHPLPSVVASCKRKLRHPNHAARDAKLCVLSFFFFFFGLASLDFISVILGRWPVFLWNVCGVCDSQLPFFSWWKPTQQSVMLPATALGSLCLLL